MNNYTKKRGFTLVEMIVVMSIIAVLTMLAAPKFLGYTRKATEIQIRNDVGVADSMIDQYLLNHDTLPAEWEIIAPDALLEYLDEARVYNTRGKVELMTGEYKILSKEFLKKNVKSHLKGLFVANDNGKTYYIHTGAAGNIEPDIPMTPMGNPFDKEPVLTGPVSSEKIEILEVIFPTGYHQTGDVVTTTIKLRANATINDVYMEHYVYHERNLWDSWKDIYFETLSAGEIKTITFDTVIDTLSFGYASVQLTWYWDGGTTQLTKDKSFYIADTDWLYYYSNDWWAINASSIGIGSLSTDRVTFGYKDSSTVTDVWSDHGTIELASADGSSVSGMVNSRDFAPYGTYEIRMRVPDSSGLLNGFFLYGPDDHEHEIDIEVLKYEGKWQLWTTIHNNIHPNFESLNAPFDPIDNPGAIFQKKIILDDLGINPSLTYNNYKIDYYPEYVSFSLNGTEISRWDGVFQFGHMELLASSFYAQWLSQDLSGTSVMDIEWVRTKVESHLLN